MLFIVVKTLESEFAGCSSFSQGAAHRGNLLATVTNRSHCGTKGDLPIQGVIVQNKRPINCLT